MKPFERHSTTAVAENLAACILALQILDRLDSATVPNPPTLLTIFRLYCAQRLTVREVAIQCKCSLGTVSNRLRLMQKVIGVHPSRIRNAARPGDAHPLQSPQFEHQNRN